MFIINENASGNIEVRVCGSVNVRDSADGKLGVIHIEDKIQA